VQGLPPSNEVYDYIIFRGGVRLSGITKTNWIRLVLFGTQNGYLVPIWQPLIGSLFHLSGLGSTEVHCGGKQVACRDIWHAQ
jgi:hypothetical protein